MPSTSTRCRNWSVQRLEARTLLSNQFVGDTFAWAGSMLTEPNGLLDIAPHPGGYLVTLIDAGVGKLFRDNFAGSPIGGPVTLHPGESWGGGGGDKVASDAAGNSVVTWVGARVL